ncbi:MAG: MATE family efflux transporter [Clostridia bacterium]|nr:MATE family efflux transporter [Clostridia bacterium]
MSVIPKFRKGFGRELFVLVLPIVIQNLISASVSLTDVIMLGRVDQVSLSASSLAGQVQFLLSTVYFGLGSALTILASQYWGRQDRLTVSRILGIGFIISMFFSITAALLAVVAPSVVMRVFTNDPELIDAGAHYLRFVAYSYLFAGLTQPYLSIMKSCERVTLSTVVSALTLGLNVILNAILIFGLFGFPRMGIMGAALATSLSRGVEFFICLVDYLHQRLLPRGFRALFVIPRSLVSDFFRYCIPAFFNDCLWGLAFSVNSMIMGHLGSDIVAANSVVSVVRELITTVGFGISSASSIMLGREIGEGELSRVRQDAGHIMYVTLVTGIIGAILLLMIIPFVPGMVILSETASGYLRIMMVISSVYQIGQLVNTLLIASFFRCGGDSRYGLRLDFLSMWCYAVPLGLISAFVLHLPPIVVYILMCTDEFAKMPFAIQHYLAGGWIRNLTRNYSE